MSSSEFFKKNEWMNSFLLLWDMFSFVFWKKLKTPIRHFEIIWPLKPSQNKKGQTFSCCSMHFKIFKMKLFFNNLKSLTISKCTFWYFKSCFLNNFLRVEGSSFFRKVHQVTNLTLPVRKKSCSKLCFSFCTYHIYISHK